MKLHADAQSALNTVTAYDVSGIEVNAQHYDGALIIMPEGVVQSWDIQTFDELTAQALSGLLAHKPEIVIIGTGAKQRFAHPSMLATLYDAHVGVESMTTPAACRTYNILMAEGRQVLAALLPMTETKR